ncbi:MAG: hypothetical protein IPL32_01250 [Chloracidobacterium sp.]|nr:hypothetical protein [Chloracidobacterium sp.]
MNILCKQVFLVVVLTLAMATAVFGQKPKRDITQYDNGVHIEFGFGYRPAELTEFRAKLRDFIWTHFSEKRLGYIKTSSYSREGDSTIEEIFIEPDKKGVWRVVSNSTSSCCTLHPPAKIKRQTKTYSIVERWEAEFDIFGGKPTHQGKQLHDNDQTKAGQYCLKLGNKSNKNPRIL